jgi:hypothetical protein
MFSHKERHRLPVVPCHVTKMEITSFSPKERDYLRLYLFPFGTKDELLAAQAKMPVGSLLYVECSGWIARRFYMVDLAVERVKDIQLLTTRWSKNHPSEEKYLDVLYFIHSSKKQPKMIQKKLEGYLRQVQGNISLARSSFA